MNRRALVVGINSYKEIGNLSACVADAEAMAERLARHKDDEKNFDCYTFADKMPDGGPISRPGLRSALADLFQYDGDVMFYFAGHGYLGSTGGLLCTFDATADDWGIPMQDVVSLAMQSPARQVLLVLDCCHSGDIGTPAFLSKLGGTNPLSTIRENMTIIAASKATELSVEAGGHGAFTAGLLDALDGGAADHMGVVTAPALYTYVSRRFSAWDQRPMYKTSSTEVFAVRNCEPLITRLQLGQLPVLFPKADYQFPMDPEHEPEDEHGNVKEPVNADKVGIAQLFKAYRDAGLLRPSDPKLQLYWVARRSGSVELTPLGREYWWLVVNDKL